MSQQLVNQTFKAKEGTVFWNGEELAELDNFEGTMSINYADLKFINNPANFRKPMSYTINGTLTIKKINSRIQRLMIDEIQSGRHPDITIMAKNVNSDAGTSQRMTYYNVTLDSLLLSRLGSSDDVIMEDIPFQSTKVRNWD